MILRLLRATLVVISILHVCGDDPITVGCYITKVTVFSTYVEMILRCEYSLISTKSILHVCGDDPISNSDIPVNIKYSPRMWR